MRKQEAIKVALDVYRHKGIEMFVVFCPWDEIDGPYAPCDDYELINWFAATSRDIVYVTSEFDI